MRFRRATGMTILDAILAERNETAKSLMRRSDLKLAAVASLFGWKIYSAFRRRFVEACGLTLDAWRAQNAL